MRIKLPVIYTIAIIYLIIPTLLFIDSYFFFESIHTNLDLIKSLEKIQFAGTAIIFFLGWCIAFCLFLKEKKVLLHDLAGILGVATSMISLAGLVIIGDKLFSVSFAMSGALCLYCISVPTYQWFKGKLKDEKFELSFLSLFVSTAIIYLADGYASISINQVFGINSDYFHYSKPVAVMLVLSPLFAIGSLLVIIYLTMFPKNNSSGVELFYTTNKLSMFYVLCYFSLIYGFW